MKEQTKNWVARNKVKCPWSQSWWRKKVYSGKDLWNRQVLATSERVTGDESGESTEVDNVTGTARGKSPVDKQTYGSDTLESFLSKVTFESDFRKKTCTCVMQSFAIFLLSKETFTIRTCSILESFFRKLLSKATFERKLSSVSLPLDKVDSFSLTNQVFHSYSSLGRVIVHQYLYKEDLLPVMQLTVSRHWMVET